MSKNNYERIELIKEDFKDNIWEKLSELLNILTTAGYGCYVWQDEFTIIIEFNWRDGELADSWHYWLTEEEGIVIDDMREQEENNLKVKENDN